jgi:hypothetical protein
LWRAAAEPISIFGEIHKMSKTTDAINPHETRYTEAEAARKLGFRNRLTLWRWRRRGLLSFYRIGQRVFYADHHLAEFLARCERKAKGVKEVA